MCILYIIKWMIPHWRGGGSTRLVTWHTDFPLPLRIFSWQMGGPWWREVLTSLHTVIEGQGKEAPPGGGGSMLPFLSVDVESLPSWFFKQKKVASKPGRSFRVLLEGRSDRTLHSPLWSGGCQQWPVRYSPVCQIQTDGNPISHRSGRSGENRQAPCFPHRGE